MKNEKTKGELEVECITLRRNREQLEKTNKLLFADCQDLMLFLATVEGVFGCDNTRVLRDRTAIAVVAFEQDRATSATLVRDCATLTEELETYAGNGNDPLRVAEEHAKLVADLQEQLEKAKEACYRVTERKRELANEKAALEAALDKWEKFGLDVRDQAIEAYSPREKAKS